MSRDLRIVLIVLGSLVAALVILATVAAALLVPRVAHEMSNSARDPGAQRSALAKIADFTVPKNFRIAQASDSFVSARVRLVSIDPAHQMQIELSRATITSEGSSDVILLGVAEMGLQFVCANVQNLRDEQFTVRGESVTFHQRECTTKSGRRMRVEIGEFEGAGPQAQLMATGADSTWDSAPIRALLRSVR